MSLLRESSIPSALAELMETPGATTKIPNVSASVGPIDEEGHSAGDADFVV